MKENDDTPEDASMQSNYELGDKDRILEKVNKDLPAGASRYEWYPSSEKFDYRFTFDHDESEIIYSNAFKRISGKTQMIIEPVRDHYRSRLSHTLEVREIALMMGRALELNTSLISAISLGHDLGHAPFGHAGEEALQQIIRRFVKEFIGVSIDEQYLPYCFHHASNSARILSRWLDKSKNDSTVTKATVLGALQHSWSPWKATAVATAKKPIFGTPSSYEAQIVAIADQVASINHDTEDLIDACEFTGVTGDRISDDMMQVVNEDELNRTHDKQKTKQLKDYVSRTVGFGRRRGHGRQARIAAAIEYVVENGRLVIPKHPSEEAADNHIPSIGDFGEFLDLYEGYIRRELTKNEWFIEKNSSAGMAVIATFNHLWPTARACADSKFRHYSDERQTESEIREDREHYTEFYHDSYDRPIRSYRLETEACRLGKDIGLEPVQIWSTFLAGHCAKSAVENLDKKLSALIPLIDFVAGLTDKYCREISTETQKKKPSA